MGRKVSDRFAESRFEFCSVVCALRLVLLLTWIVCIRIGQSRRGLGAVPAPKSLHCAWTREAVVG